MRLGNYTTQLTTNSVVERTYRSVSPDRSNDAGEVVERHRHRFEVNPIYVDVLKKNGLIVSGTDKKTHLVEFIEHA